MFPRRFIIVAAAVLLIIGLVVVPNIQRDAWLQGYLTGQLAAQDGGKAAPLTPYLYPGYAGQGYGPHFGWLGGLLFLGFLFVVFRVVGGCFRRRAWQHFYGPYGQYQGGPQRQGESGPRPEGQPGVPEGSAEQTGAWGWHGGPRGRGGPRPPWWGWGWDEPEPRGPEQTGRA